MNLIAHTTDGMNINAKVPVKSISVWLNRSCNHSVNDTSLKELLLSAKESGKMQIYASGQFEGAIDSFDGTPLYTNGQLTVTKLELNGSIIWAS